MKRILFINKKLIFIEFIVYLLFSSVFFKIGYFDINNAFIKFRLFSIYDLKCVFLAKHQTGQLKEYVYPSASITAYTNSNLTIPIRAEILMQSQEANTFEDIILSHDEVAVSRNISVKLNIGLNDFLFIDTGYKNISKYVVSHIIDYS
jgi:hypothetical protein